MTNEDVMAALEASLLAGLPSHKVQRGMVLDVAALQASELEAGFLSFKCKGGGNFLNWQGREGEGNDLDVVFVGYVSVAERATTEDLEMAELAFLQDVLVWCQAPKAEPLDAVVPVEFRLSDGLDLPHGWFYLDVKVRWL